MFIVQFWVFSCILISLIQGEKPKCTGNEALAKELLSENHYGEVGYLRDTCVELARHLHVELGLSEETKPCKELAETRTSTLTWPNCLGKKKEEAVTRTSKLTWLNCFWKKRKRNDEDKLDVKMKERALAMLVHFNEEVWKNSGTIKIENQKFVIDYIDDVVRRLRESKAVEETSDIIKQIEQLKTTYCRGYYDQQKRKADEVTASRRVEEEEAAQLTENQQIQNGREDKTKVKLIPINDADNKHPPIEDINNPNTPANEAEENFLQLSDYKDVPIEDVSSPETHANELEEKFSQLSDPPSDYVESDTEIEEEYFVYSNDEKEKLLQKEARLKKQQAKMEMAEAFEYKETTFNYNRELPLHETVFNGNAGRLAFLLKKGKNTATKDKYGNTPLHLAVMLGRKVCIYLLLRYGASVRTRNLAGWSPVEEAVSYGDRDIILVLWRKFHQQFHDEMFQKRKNLLKGLRNTANFYMKLRWDLHSYWPGLSRVLPSDTYEVYKQGLTVRLDTSLHHFNVFLMRWERSKISFIFKGATPQPFTIRIDHADKTFGRVLENEKTEKILHWEVDLMMSSDLLTFSVVQDRVTLTRAQQSSGPFGRGPKKVKTIMLGPYQADFYNINGLVFVQRKRNEHLSPEQIKHNNDLDVVEMLANGIDIMMLFRAGKTIPVVPLSPVPENKVTWEAYINSKSGEPPTLGRPRPQFPKKTELHVAPEIAMASNLPIDRDFVVDFLEAVAPFKHFADLRDFIKILPAGFPVQLEIPIKASISAKYTLLDCQVKDMPDHIFVVPSGFKELHYAPYDPVLF